VPFEPLREGASLRLRRGNRPRAYTPS